MGKSVKTKKSKSTVENKAARTIKRVFRGHRARVNLQSRKASDNFLSKVESHPPKWWWQPFCCTSKNSVAPIPSTSDVAAVKCKNGHRMEGPKNTTVKQTESPT